MGVRWKYCSKNKVFLNKTNYVVLRVENSKSVYGTFCPFFICEKLIIVRCRSPPFINFELKKFEIDRRKKYGKNAYKK